MDFFDELRNHYTVDEIAENFNILLNSYGTKEIKAKKPKARNFLFDMYMIALKYI